MEIILSADPSERDRTPTSTCCNPHTLFNNLMESVLLSPFNLHFLSVTSSMSSFSELLFRLCLTCLSVCDYQVCVLDIKGCGCPPLLTSPSVEPENPDACVPAVSNSCLALRFCLLSPPFLFPLVSFLCSLSVSRRRGLCPSVRCVR